MKVEEMSPLKVLQALHDWRKIAWEHERGLPFSDVVLAKMQNGGGELILTGDGLVTAFGALRVAAELNDDLVDRYDITTESLLKTLEDTKLIDVLDLAMEEE